MGRSGVLWCRYVFASRELPEYGGSQYNDAFSLEVNDVKLAKLTDGAHLTRMHFTASSNPASYRHSPTPCSAFSTAGFLSYHVCV